MNENSDIFLNKKILIYGLGKSGFSTFIFLKKKSKVFLFDDNKKIKLKSKFKKYFLSIHQIKKNNFDIIILSPGINIDKCKLNKFLKKNLKKVYTDLDVFNSFYKNLCVTITGTNGKSTTCQLLYEVLKRQKYDVKLVGNIGNPILSTKNIKKKTIFVIEASSYQLEYSKIFKSKYVAILNISPDHLERHKNLSKYVSAKFKLLKNQNENSTAFVNKNNKYIQNKIKRNKYKSIIINVDTKSKKINKYKHLNEYVSSGSNIENLLFVLEIARKFKVKKINLIGAIKKFKGLKYRQQTIFKDKNFSIINDSKSTSYSSSIEMLKKNNSIYWLIGGIPKKDDKFYLSRNYFKNIKGYIFGINQKKFISDLSDKIKLKKSKNLKNALVEVFKDIRVDNSKKKIIILFSPAAASFDCFKNFEVRGLYFNKIIKRYIYAKKSF